MGEIKRDARGNVDWSQYPKPWILIPTFGPMSDLEKDHYLWNMKHNPEATRRGLNVLTYVFLPACLTPLLILICAAFGL